MSHELRNKFPGKGSARSAECSITAGIQNHRVGEIIRERRQGLRASDRDRFCECNSGLGQTPAKLRRFAAVQLQGIDKWKLSNSACVLPVRISEHGDLASVSRQLVNPCARTFNRDKTLAAPHQ